MISGRPPGTVRVARARAGHDQGATAAASAPDLFHQTTTGKQVEERHQLDGDCGGRCRLVVLQAVASRVSNGENRRQLWTTRRSRRQSRREPACTREDTARDRSHASCHEGLAACGGSHGISGTVIDRMTANTGNLCTSIGNQQVALTNAAGTIIARDDASYMWTGTACVIEFSFSDVPQLAGYGITIPGLGAGTSWLTPAQAAKPVTLSLASGPSLS